VANDAGETLAGRNGRTGPNLYGVAGRPAASVEDFRYSPSITAAGEAGVVWTEEAFVAYVQDPTAFLKEATGDNRARSAMAFRVRGEEDAKNVYAYLASLAAQ
jgi:cytochrome c